MHRLRSKFNSLAFLDVSIANGSKRGRIVFELFDKTTPKTCTNFRSFFKEKDINLVTKPRLHEIIEEELETVDFPIKNVNLSYKGCSFHRVVPNFLIQTGDVLYNNGYGCITGVGLPYLVDENFDVRFNKPGILAMANSGPNSNGCQFFITTAAAPTLNGRCVGFGEVICGYEYVKDIEQTGSPSGHTSSESKIEDIGLISIDEYIELVKEETDRISQRIAQKKEEKRREVIKIISSIREGQKLLKFK